MILTYLMSPSYLTSLALIGDKTGRTNGPFRETNTDSIFSRKKDFGSTVFWWTQCTMSCIIHSWWCVKDVSYLTMVTFWADKAI